MTGCPANTRPMVILGPLDSACRAAALRVGRARWATARRMSGGPSCCDAIQLLPAGSSVRVRAREVGTGHSRWSVDLRVTRVGHLPVVSLVPRVPVHLLRVGEV